MLRITTMFLIVAAVLLAGEPAVTVPGLHAQNAPVEARPTVKLTSEDRHVVKENVLTSPGLKKESADVSVSMGGPTPANIAVHEFPKLVAEKVPQLKAHRFFVKGDVVVIVDPKDNKIADIIE